ncbi:MAG TPA: AAA family ATPase [Planctomycetota bacterium]|nr:AAA family ATPase [Planctomycetota bacterium]
MIHIRELWIDGFGCLRTPSEPIRFERERITLFLDPNEAGKTTLQTAILASLYGIEDDERRTLSPRPRKAHWAPAAGPPFGTRLRLSDGKRTLELRWDFAKGNDLRVVDLTTNKLITAELCPGNDPTQLGHALLGLTVQEFLKTSLVRQDDVRGVADAEGLDALVQRAADTQAGGSTVASAQDALRAILRHYPGVTLKEGGRIENEIARLEEAVATLQRQADELEAERAAIRDRDAEFQRLTAEREDLRREAARLDYLAHVAELDELRVQIDDAQKRRAALAALEAERDKLAHLESFPASQEDDLLQWQAARLGHLRNAEQAERTIAELRRNTLDPARAELDTLGPLATATQEHMDSVQQLLGKTRDFEAREQRLHDDVDREEAQLTAQGASVEELDRLEERFAHLEPDDAEFLLDHDRAVARAASETEEAKRLSLEATLRIDRITAERERQREAGHRLLITGGIIGLAAVALAVPFAFLEPLAAVAIAVVGLAAAAWVALRGRRVAASAESLQAEQLAAAQRALADAEERRERLATEQRQLEQRLRALATRFGYEQSEVLAEDYASLDDLRRLCGTLILLRLHEAELDGERQAAEAEVTAVLQPWGQDRPLGVSLSRALTTLRERMSASLRLRQRIADVSRKLDEESERLNVLRGEAEALTTRLRALFAAAGIEPQHSVEASIAIFNDLARQHRRLRQLGDELLPQASSGLVEPKKLDAMRADAERLHRAITTMREERPALLSLEARERATEYRCLRDKAKRDEEAARSQADEAGRSIINTLNRYHAERPALEDALTERREALARARRHAAALELASRVLDDIGSEVHGQWAEELNRSASTLLRRIAPSLNDLKFDNRLSFGLTHRGLPEPVQGTDAAPRRDAPSPILSAGTWDQVCLAVRLCIADFVGRRAGGGLLLLDDPFAHFDDPRFEAAMRVLGELPRSRHQLILFSCQGQRFQWLRNRDPRWFDTHVALRRIASARPGTP